MVQAEFLVLLDTNAMTSLSLYVECCKLAGKKVGAEIGEIKNELIKKKVPCEWLEFKEKSGINSGHKVFKYLSLKSGEYELRTYFPAFADIEALHLLMERRFDQVLTRRGVPYRLRVKKSLKVQVDFNYSQVYENWDQFKTELSANQIELYSPEREYGGGGGYINEIATICYTLMKYLLLDTIDLFIYGIGLRIGANEIYTLDGEFKEIINNVAKGREEWKDIREKVTSDLKDQLPSVKEEYEHNNGTITFPVGVPTKA